MKLKEFGPWGRPKFYYVDPSLITVCNGSQRHSQSAMIYDVIEQRFNVTMLFTLSGSSNWMGGSEEEGTGCQ